MTNTAELDLKRIAEELGRISHALEAIALKNDPDFVAARRASIAPVEVARPGGSRAIYLEEDDLSKES